MIQIYVPTQLVSATAEVQKKHTSTERGLVRLSETELKELLNMICNATEAGFETIVSMLTKRQVSALCDYLPLNRFSFPTERIERTIVARINETIYRKLFEQWQRYPQNRSLISILGTTNQKEEIVKDLPLKSFEFKAMLLHLKSSYEFYQKLEPMIMKYDDRVGFREQFSRKGLIPNTALYYGVYASHLTTVTWNFIIKEGDGNAAMGMMRCPSDDVVVKLIDHFLGMGNANRKEMVRFKSCFTEIQRRFHTYNDAYRVLSDLGSKTYLWWLKYRELEEGFNRDADPRRREFWGEFLDKCDITRYRQQHFLVMNFSGVVAIESEEIGKIYFYDKTYFENTVRPKIVKMSSSEAKSYMTNRTSPLYEKAHLGYWWNEVRNKLVQMKMI